MEIEITKIHLVFCTLFLIYSKRGHPNGMMLCYNSKYTHFFRFCIECANKIKNILFVVCYCLLVFNVHFAGRCRKFNYYNGSIDG